MANNTLNTRILLCSSTKTEWANSSKVLLKGEVALEFDDTDTSLAPKFKVGNGVNTFAELPYATLTAKELDSAVKNVHNHANKSILDAVQVALTNALKANYDKAYQHSQTAHAPANAEKNVIQTIQVNGTALTPDTSRSVNVNVPITGGDVTVNSDHKMSVTHVNAGAVSGTLAAGNIPNLDASKIASGALDTARIPGLDASKITSGVFDLARIPQAALERLVIVADDTARYKLTTSNVQKGDSVKVTSTGRMYIVVDDSKLSSADGYVEYSAGTAANVAWSGVTGKPAWTNQSATSSADGYMSKRQASDLTNVKDNYLKGVAINGRTITITKGNGSTFRVTTQDTTYGAATASVYGLVKTGTGTNQVTLNNGVMTLNAVSTDNLRNGSNVLIFNGGSAS